MASSLLDELPCLLDEADELMARLAFYIKPFPTKSTVSEPSSSSGSTATAIGSTADEQLSVAALRANLSSSETESALKFFAKQFLMSQPVPIEKVLAHLPLQRPDSQGAQLQFVAKRVFHLMKRVHHWQRAAWGLVTQFFAEAAYLTFARHRLLTALLLNTLTKYVKVHLLWTSCPSIPSLLAVHTFVQYSSTLPSGVPGQSSDPGTTMYSPLDHVDQHLHEYVLCFGSSPLSKIQQDFQQHPDGNEIARNLAALALSCFESFVGCHDLEQLRNQGAFDVETFFHGGYASLPVYEDLLYSHEQEEWVLCVALCLPQQLKSTSSSSSSSARTSSGVQLWDFVQIIAQDRLVLPVFRDVAVNVHTLLYQQITSMPSAAGATNLSSSAFTSGGQLPLKKLMSALSKQALRTCAEQHAQRAQFTTWLLKTLIHLLIVRGGLIAPLFSVLLGACRLTRTEIEWLLAHEDQPQALLLPAHVKAKHLQRAQRSFTGNAGTCGELLALTHKLRALMQQHAHFVKGYYEEFLSCGDADAIAFEIHELLDNDDDPQRYEFSGDAVDLARSSASPLDAHVQQILRSFAIKERYQPVSDGSELKASPWRREWRQLSVVLLTNDAPSKRLPTTLLRLMERACQHAKYVESASSVLDHHAQIAKWCWRPALVEKLYQQLLQSTNGASQAVAMLEIVDATISGDYALDEIVEEAEARELGLQLQELYQRMEDALGAQLERTIDSTVAVEAALHSISVRQAGEQPQGSRAERSQHHEAQIASQASKSLKSSESRLPSAISSLRSSGKTTPKAWFPSQAPNSPSLCVPSGPLGSLVKADEALCKLTSAILKSTLTSSDDADNSGKLTGIVERHVKMCLSRFLRGLVEVSEGASSSSTSQIGSRTPGSKLRCSLQHAGVELQCYVSCIQRLFRNAGFVDLTQVILSTLASETLLPEGDEVNEQRLIEVHQWNLVERISWFYRSMLQSKSAPVAPALGSALIASRRKQSFVVVCQQMSTKPERESLAASPVLPEGFASLEALHSLREILGRNGIQALGASIMGCVCTQVQVLGCLLEHDEIALIRFDKCIDAPYSELAMAVRQMTRLEELVAQLVQIGLHLFFAELLQQIEQSFSIHSDPQWHPSLRGDDSNSAPRPSWRLLPVAFAASFHSDVWRCTKYLEALDATDTNAHMSCTALLYLLQRTATSSASHADDELRRVVRLSSQAALGLRAATKELPSPAMLAAVRMFAELAAAAPEGHEKESEDTTAERHSHRLELGILDDCLPDIVSRILSSG